MSSGSDSRDDSKDPSARVDLADTDEPELKVDPKEAGPAIESEASPDQFGDASAVAEGIPTPPDTASYAEEPSLADREVGERDIDGERERAQDYQDYADTMNVPAWDASLNRGTVTWTDVTEAYFQAREEFNADPYSRALHMKYWIMLSDSFFDSYGGPLMVYNTDYFIGSAVHTDRGEIHVTANYPMVTERQTEEDESDLARWTEQADQLIELIGKATRLQDKVRIFLRPIRNRLGKKADPQNTVRAIITEQLYSITTYALGILDAIAVRQESESKGIVSWLESEYEAAEVRYKSAVTRQGIIWYLAGMLVGALVVPLLIWGSLYLVPGIEESQSLIRISIAFGAIGAFVSTMLRMTRSTLSFRDDSMPWEISLLGGIRTLLGSIFGLVIYVFVASGIVPFEVPSESPANLYFFGAVGFLSGFSEKFAADTIVTSEKWFGGSSQKPDVEEEAENAAAS